jgi:hypothetical protein
MLRHKGSSNIVLSTQRSSMMRGGSANHAIARITKQVNFPQLISRTIKDGSNNTRSAVIGKVNELQIYNQ